MLAQPQGFKLWQPTIKQIGLGPINGGLERTATRTLIPTRRA
jgi:hypothetical protein